MSVAADSMLPKLVDDPEAPAPAVEPWARPGRKNKKTCHRALLVGSLMMTLLLLACFVLGRESASSAAWLQIDLLAKLTAMNNGTAAGTYYGR
jgi:xyloglucan fucosyltransferase